MKNFIKINNLLDEIKKKGFVTWIDKLKFLYIFFIWAGIILIFGLIYYYFSGSNSMILYSQDSTPVMRLTDSIYFSFITATTTGFGDIIPTGKFKIIAILEVIFGLLLLALVTSKLVSLKQTVILSEVYDISIKERINRLRSSLFLFRQNITRFMTRMEDNTLRKNEIRLLYGYLSGFEDTLSEVLVFVNRAGRNEFIRKMDLLTAELIANSIANSFEKLNEFIIISKENNFEWKTDLSRNLVEKSINMAQKVFGALTSSDILKRQLQNPFEHFNKNIKITQAEIK